VADVSGHGQGVSAIAANLRLLMRKNVNRLDQGEFVGAMNREFSALAEAGCFATAVVTTFFAPTNYLTLCNAGHPPPMLYRASQRQWRLLEDAAGGLPLGVIELAEYGQFGVELEPGDLVLCYTDSLIEAKSADGEMLGTAGLVEIVRGVGVTRPAEFIPALLAEIAARHSGNLEGDDVTALVFTPNRATRKVGFFKRAAAPLRLLKAMVGALRPGGEPVPWPDLKLANIGGAILPPLSRFWKCASRRT
jgi:serine phosphatase RsbU (regulator of sigma subunit)